MKIYLQTFGCKVNQYETAAISGLFERAGHEICHSAGVAAVIVVNSCTVTSASDGKTLRTLRALRRENPAAVICLCGCMPQAFPERAAAIAEADIITGSAGRERLVQLVERFLQTGTRVVDIAEHDREQDDMSASAFEGHTRAYIKIEDGCERFCSYCVIPRARGPVRSKPLADIAAELRATVAAGYREAVLVGINLSCYGTDSGATLMDAVATACAEPGIARVRLGSLEPELLGDAQIHALAAQEKLCPQFHLSLQSGCDETLRAMNRRYTAREYAAIADRLRQSFDNAAITTDIMVGFPGETQATFEDSMDFVAAMGFARAHVFPYSPRAGTVAASMPEQIPTEEKRRRQREMSALCERNAAAFLQTQLGRDAQVLFENRVKNGFCEGYTENYTPAKMRIATGEQLRGQIVRVRAEAVEDGMLVVGRR